MMIVLLSGMAYAANTYIANTFINVDNLEGLVEGYNVTDAVGNITALQGENATLWGSINGKINVAGDTVLGNLNMSGNALTDIGSLIVEGLTTGRNIVPDTSALYSLGNATLWWDKAYINNVYSQFVNASQMNSTEMNSKRGNFEDNITIAGFKVMKEGVNMVVRLG